MVVTIDCKSRKAGNPFVLVLKEVKETFLVSKEAVSIRPTLEPEAVIDIPENTFEEQSNLVLNVRSH